MARRRQGWRASQTGQRAISEPLRLWWAAYTRHMIGSVPDSLAGRTLEELTDTELSDALTLLTAAQRRAPGAPSADTLVRRGKPAALKAAEVEIRALRRLGMPPEVEARLRPPPPPTQLGLPMADPGAPPGGVGIAYSGVDITGTIEGRVLEGWASRGVRLIKRVPDDMRADLPGQIRQAVASGQRSSTLRQIIQQRFDVGESRLQLIARDQIAKLNAEITQNLQSEAGVTHYIWRAGNDERVRESHLQASGQVVAWASSGVDGTGPYGEPTHPGEGIQCRCTAEAVVPESWAVRRSTSRESRRFDRANELRAQRRARRAA